MIIFPVLEKAMNCCAIAYAVSAVSRINPSLYAHSDNKTGDKKGFFENIRGVISRQPEDVHKVWMENTRKICKGRYIDPDLLKTWVLHASPNSKPWLYFPDQEVVKNYNLEPIGGLLGNAKYHAPVLLAVIATRKNSELRDKNVYIAFKGTQGGLGLVSVITAWLFNKVLSEWSTNMSFKLVKDDYGIFPGLVHEGFLNAFRSFQKHLDAFLTEHDACQNPVIVTGHSLGGALAIFTAYYLKKRRPFLNVSLVTFAEPNVGDAAFVSAIEDLLKCKIFSYYLEGDFCKIKFPGYEPLNSAMDVSHFLAIDLGLTAIKAHYFEGIRLALYVKNNTRLNYRPIIRELRFDKVCDNPEKLLINFLPAASRDVIEMFD